jgi:methionine-rich copper-binding protein CopC
MVLYFLWTNLTHLPPAELAIGYETMSLKQKGLEMRRFALSLIVAGLLYWANPLYGHAVLLSATPAVEAVVQGPNVPIQLRFNSRIDSKRSSLKLIGPDGKPQALAIGDQASPDVLSSQASGVVKGSYVLQWQVLASDGHITRGAVRFKVE